MNQYPCTTQRKLLDQPPPFLKLGTAFATAAAAMPPPCVRKEEKALATAALSSSSTAYSSNAKSKEPADNQAAQPSSSYAPLDQQEDDPQWKSWRYDRWQNRQWYHEEWKSGSWGCRQDDGEGYTWPHTAADLGWAGRVEPQISDKMSAALDTHPVPMPATISPWTEHSADHRGQF